MYLNSQTISAGVVQVLHRPMLHVVDFIVHFQLNLLYKLFFGMCKHKYVKIGGQSTLRWMYIGENLLQSWVHSKAKVYVK